MENTTITITRENLKELKKLYEKAVEEKQTTFYFGSYHLVTSYAKYLIEYAGGRLNVAQRITLPRL